MPGNISNSGKLIGIFILGCVLFCYPILSIFNSKTLFWGIPILYMYIFAAWIGLIFSIYLGARTHAKSKISKASDVIPTTDSCD